MFGYTRRQPDQNRIRRLDIAGPVKLHANARKDLRSRLFARRQNAARHESFALQAGKHYRIPGVRRGPNCRPKTHRQQQKSDRKHKRSPVLNWGPLTRGPISQRSGKELLSSCIEREDMLHATAQAYQKYGIHLIEIVDGCHHAVLPSHPAKKGVS